MILTVSLNGNTDRCYMVDKSAAIAGAKVISTGFTPWMSGNLLEESLKLFDIEGAYYYLKEEEVPQVPNWDEISKNFLHHYRRLMKRAEVIVLSGDLPPGLDSRFYQKLIRIAKKAGKKVIIDSDRTILETDSIEPPTMVSVHVADVPGCHHKKELLEIIKDAEAIQKKGVELVLLSLGNGDSLLVCDEGVYRSRAPLNVAESLSAGSCCCGGGLIAGFALGLAESQSLPDTYKEASAISAASGSLKDCIAFNNDDIQRYHSRILIEKIK